ncbi:CHASE3 domain-containing protein [Rhizobium sp. XQZ8]|nr:CHASE3 domain-containing protein [Rhizobium populisoli]
MTEHTYSVITSLNSVAASMVDQETGVRGFLLSGDEAFLEPQKKGASRFRESLDRVRSLTVDNSAQQRRLDEVESLARQWSQKVVETELPLMRNPATREQARSIENSGVGKAAMDGIRAKVAEMVADERALLKDRRAAADEAADTASLMTVGGGILVLLVALIALAIVHTGVVRPVRSIRDAMLRLSEGDRASDIPHLRRRDEIGEMAGAVATFREAAIRNHELEQEAVASRERAERERIRLTEAAEAAAQARLNEATAGLAAGLRKIAAGDLSFQLDEPFAPDFEALRHDLNGAVKQLSEALGAVASTTASIDSGSQEISRAAGDLSRRTESQAASLEETAAALDQITANVANSSQRVNEARGVAAEANKSAKSSGEVVANAVQAMERIEESSSQIASIISVIDEIAFQTNLLALNAGVEAARAGEAGKGFAVVAQEVRELAQRSAKAAKEIRELIRQSSEEVGSGVELVRETGTALQTIGQFIATMNQHMEAIATSSREQAVALGEVNTAVNQMDQVTQQNAAMVEETSAAGATLASDAVRLRELVGRFALPGNNDSLRQVARRMAAAQQPRRLPSHQGNLAVKEEWSEF